MKRWADVYVFALRHHKERESVDPMNLDQWDFICCAHTRPEWLHAKPTPQHICIAEKVATSLSYAELSAQFPLLAKPGAPQTGEILQR